MPCHESGRLTDDIGLVNCHAYPIIGTTVLQRNGIRLLKLRNPWNKEHYEGLYSDFSQDLTLQEREDLMHDSANDGIFYIPIEEYFSHVLYTSVNYDVDDWYHDYHLVIDDDGSNS